jgi:hypothetical protein
MSSWRRRSSSGQGKGVDVDTVRESDFKERRGVIAKEKVLRRARPGAPSKDPIPHGKRNVLLSQKAYERLRAGRDRAERRLAQIKLEHDVKRKEKRTAKLGRSTKTVSERAALHAYLQTQGVSARRIPFVMAACSKYFLGFVNYKELSVASTALTNVRIVGFCLEEKLCRSITSSGTPFYIGFDSSARGSSITSTCLSYLKESFVPQVDFLRFERLHGHKAPDYVKLLVNLIRTLPESQFRGISTDNTNAMSGRDAGVGALLQNELGRFVRHDTCELHASASVIRVFETIWPAAINRCCVTQFIYVAWYILNSDWALCRARMVELLGAGDVMPSEMTEFLLNQFPGVRPEVSAETIKIDLLKKPEKPSSTRWGTMSSVFRYVFKFLPVLRAVFDSIRKQAGAGDASKPGSIPAMCSEWITWSGSEKLRAQLFLCVEFIEELWLPQDALIYAKDEAWGFASHFQVFGRPRRALEFLIQAEDRLQHFRELKSHEMMTKAYEDDVEHVDNFLEFFHSLVKSRVKGNFGRYLTGLYAFAGFGDPYFAPICWEAFTRWQNFQLRPGMKTANTNRGRRLEAELRASYSLLDSHHRALLRKYMLDDYFCDAWKLVGVVWGKAITATLCKQFAETIRDSSETNLVAKILIDLAPALSTTQPVEFTFHAYDMQPGRGKKFKTKASQAAGGAAEPDLASARVQTHAVVSSVERSISQKLAKERARVEARKDIAQSVVTSLDALTFPLHEFGNASAKSKQREKRRRVPRSGVSEAAQAFLRRLEQEAAQKNSVRKACRDLVNAGANLKLPLNVECYGTEQCVMSDKDTKQGRPGKQIACSKCERNFHVKCLENAVEITKAQVKDEEFLKVFECVYCREGFSAPDDQADEDNDDE